MNPSLPKNRTPKRLIVRMRQLFLSLLFALICSHLCFAGILPLAGIDQHAATDVHNQYRIAAGATAMQKLVRRQHKSVDESYRGLFLAMERATGTTRSNIRFAMQLQAF